MQQRGGLSTLQLMHAAFPYMTVIGVCLVPLAGEGGVWRTLLTLSEQSTTVTRIVGSCIAAVLINFSTTLVLGVTSALALVLLGQMKTCSVLLAGFLLFDAHPNRLQLVGAAVAVVAVGMYAILKARGDAIQPKPI